MTITDIGINQIAAIVGSSIANRFEYIAIGTGSTTVVVAQSGLNTETDRNAMTSTDISVAGKVSYIADFSSTEISGTSFKEWGIFTSGPTDTGSIFNREVVPTTEFEGDRELQIQTTIRFQRN